MRRIATAIVSVVFLTGGVIIGNADGFDPAHPYDYLNVTQQSAIEFVKWVASDPCIQLPLGRIHVKPLSQVPLVKFLNDLTAAGIVSYKNAPRANQGTLDDLASHAGQEFGEGDLDVELMPRVGPEHLKAPGCLRQSSGIGNVALTSWNPNSMATRAGTKRNIVVAQGTYEKPGPYDSLYLDYVKVAGTKVIQHGKFRILFAYDEFRKSWKLEAADFGEVNEPNFRTNYVEQHLND